ncbi:NnrU family protein [uncultured Pelagimonas sp.]|uniref:NnrU family protein n=1 Tax=uncultured Pelagimonas sp. TaxID=1618102 RepID=UPI002602B444|nr:NnrU family protein [uncultured Pelagimonas sp.]
MGWIEFGLAMMLFMASHRIPSALGVKDSLIERLGSRGYTALFSIASTLLLLWVIWAAGRAPFVPLWDQTPAARWAVNLVMPVVIALSAFGVGAPNPFAFEGRSTGFDPDHPGIAGVTRQPLLWALALWSLAHLWANGDLAHVILFGTFAGFSLLGMKLVERRRARMMGHDWDRLSAQTALVPFAAMFTGKWRPQSGPSLVRLTIAVIAWAAVFHLHEWVIGVMPNP